MRRGHLQGNTGTEGVLAWIRRRERRERRRSTVELCAYVVASQVLGLAVFAQCYRGILAGTLLGRVGAVGAIGVAVLIGAAAVVAPARCGAVLAACFHYLGGVLRVATAVALGVVYLLTLPFAVTVGRRRFTREHRHGAAWADRRRDWRVGGWSEKRCEGDTKDLRTRSALIGLLGYFVWRRNLFLLTVTCVLLVAVSLSVLTHVPYIAPFVYTLF